jgi:hypothetical protein
MSKRTLKEFRTSASTRGTYRGYGTPQVIPVVDKAQEDLTQLGELEDQANAEQEDADRDTAEKAEGNIPRGSIGGEKPPMGFSTGGVD